MFANDRWSPGATLPGFASEAEASVWLGNHLRPHVARLEKEVWMQHPLADIPKPRRVDYIALVRQFRPEALEPTLLAIEIKSGSGSNLDPWRQWIRALMQATVYRYGRIVDRRSTVYRNRRPDWAFVFPDPRDLPTWPPGGYAGWPDGAERLAGRFNVGTIRYRRDYGGGSHLLFTCAASPLWSTLHGASSSADHGTHMQAGAR